MLPGQIYGYYTSFMLVNHFGKLHSDSGSFGDPLNGSEEVVAA